ncbi:MAG TPA: hypothetical protein VFP87_09510 [Chitinophagaceae bacterium]|nr:hypothetical protein [Chitinophagaceae bacterium]
MSYLKTIFIFLLPLHGFSQDLRGIWTGFLQVDNDKLPYELVISGEKNNLSGYSLMIFTFNGVENVGVKTMEIKVKRASVALEDGDLIYDNYTTPPRHVKFYASLAWVGRDSNMTLAGTFSTRSVDMRTALHENAFKGVVHLEKKNKSVKTKLTDKLTEMDLMKQLSFTEPPKKEEQNISTEIKGKGSAKSSRIKAKELSSEKATGSKNSEKVKQQIAAPRGIPAADVVKRKTDIIQTVSFKSDSLKLSLYDNGEVDGDTVTIVLNGNTIMPKVGLTAKGIAQTIPTSGLGDSSRLVMYAENLGRIPPNTGLLILQDGNDRYQIRFSGDLQNNSAIILRRKH